MGGARWGCTHGAGEQCPRDLRQAKLDGTMGSRHPELRAVLARGPSAPPLSPAYFTAELWRAKRIELVVSKTPIGPANSALHIAGCCSGLPTCLADQPLAPGTLRGAPVSPSSTAAS